MREERCVCCGAIIPEGRMVCPLCEINPPKDEFKPKPKKFDFFSKLWYNLIVKRRKRNGLFIQIDRR